VKKFALTFVKWWIIIQIGAGIASGVYLAVTFSPEEVERIMSCVAY